MRVLVTGASGFFGGNVARVLAEHGGYELCCPVRSEPPEGHEDWGWRRLDLGDRPAVIGAAEGFRPEAIVHCAILNDFQRLYSHRREGWGAYVGMTRDLADAANRCGARLVLISTDWVFDGTGHEVPEDEPPNPVNLYGFLKAASELVVAERAERGSVARIAAVNGSHWTRPESPRRQDAGFGYFLASVVDELSAGREFTVWSGAGVNAVATPSLASDSAERVRRILERDLDGTFHCVGAEAVERVELARRAAEAFELDPNLVRTGPAPAGELPDAPVPRDTSLSAERTAELLGLPALPLDEMLARFREEQETGRLSLAGAGGVR